MMERREEKNSVDIREEGKKNSVVTSERRERRIVNQR